jgi:hypothetical protein
MPVYGLNDGPARRPTEKELLLQKFRETAKRRKTNNNSKRTKR